ncbi:MAG: DUF1214 domain-containing protein [Porticoccaceae bacterium]
METQLLRDAWEEYQRTTEEMRELVESSDRFRNSPENRAKAYHGLIEAQAMAYNLALAPRVEYPVIHNRFWYGDLYTLGGNSPDFYYGTLFLDGSREYRLTGNYGDYRMIIAQSFSHVLGHPDSKMLGNYEFDKFELGDDGSFEVILSADKHEGNWIPLDRNSKYNFVFVRRAVSDWNDELGHMELSLIGEKHYYDELDILAQAERIHNAAHVLRYLVRQWNVDVYQQFLDANDGEKNTVKLLPGTVNAESTMGSPSTFYVWGAYELADDEALIIEMDVPDAGYWSIQLFDVWTKPLDFINRQTDVNMSRAAIDSDGKYRVVISARDPGVTNWLDTGGRKEGGIVGRNYLSRAVPGDPVARLVKFSEVHENLPKETKMVTPAERREALEYRHKSYLKMFNEF